LCASILNISSRLGHLDSTSLRAENMSTDDIACKQTLYDDTSGVCCRSENRTSSRTRKACGIITVRWFCPIHIQYRLFVYTEDTSSGTYWLTYRRGTTVRLLASKSHLKPVFRTNTATDMGAHRIPRPPHTHPHPHTHTPTHAMRDTQRRKILAVFRVEEYHSSEKIRL